MGKQCKFDQNAIRSPSDDPTKLDSAQSADDLRYNYLVVENALTARHLDVREVPLILALAQAPERITSLPVGERLFLDTAVHE